MCTYAAELWASATWRESCFTRQLLHVAAASVSYRVDSQAQWHEKLLPSEHNADARHILSPIIRIAKKRQYHETARLMQSARSSAEDARYLALTALSGERSPGALLQVTSAVWVAAVEVAKFRSHQVSSFTDMLELVDAMLSCLQASMGHSQGAAGCRSIGRVSGEFTFAADGQVSICRSMFQSHRALDFCLCAF